MKNVNLYNLRSYAFSILIASFISNTAIAQENYFNLLGDKSSVEIPITYRSGFIVLKATINQEHAINLILDTGAENLILFDYQEAIEMDLSLDREVKVKGSDIDGEAIAYISRANKIALEGTSDLRTDIIILKENFLELSNLIGMPVDGILGGRTFWNLALKIDYVNGLLTLTKKRKFIPPIYLDTKYTEVDIEIKNHKPYLYSNLTLSQGEEVASKTLLDTGSAVSLMVLLNTSDQLHLPLKYIKGKLGRGIGGDIKGYIGKIHGLNFTDQHHFGSMVSYYQNIMGYIDPEIYNQRNAIIGNPILSRFDLVIDYVDAKLYLKPNKNYKKKLKFDKSGIVIYAVGQHLNEYVIQEVYDRSPGKESGLFPGDIIKRIGLRPSFLLSLDTITRIFQRKEGRKVKVIINRDGKKMAKTLILRDYLEL